MQLTVNGESHELPEPATLLQLLEAVEAPLDRVAVMVNDDVVPKEQRHSITLSQGDSVEILVLAAGG